MNELFDMAWARAKFEYKPGKFKFGWLAKNSSDKSLGAFLPFQGRAYLLSPNEMAYVSLARKP